METYTITIHSIHNFGSVFQAYALQKAIQNLGYNNYIIDYRPNYNLVGKNKIKTFIGKILNYKFYSIKNDKYNKFIRNKLETTERFSNFDEVKEYFKNKSNYILISGGDQLWNPYHYCGNDSTYRLTFSNENVNKIAYGTSLGKSCFSFEEIHRLCEDINSFKNIGVREASSVKILKSQDIKNVTNVCDPVLLLDKQDYMQFIGKPLIKEKYVFVYLINESECLSKILKNLHERYGYKIVHVCGFRKKFENDYMIKDEGPEDVLNLLYYSDFVISASFHATLFSIYFNKNFYTFLPNENTNERITELLNKFKLSNRIISSFDNYCCNDKCIDYSEANVIVDEFRGSSWDFLKKTLGDLDE